MNIKFHPVESKNPNKPDNSSKFYGNTQLSEKVASSRLASEISMPIP